MVIEGSRSQADHHALSLLAETAGALGVQVTVLHHGLGRLARFRLRQKLRGLAADLFVVSGAASLEEVRRLATVGGTPIVACYWPQGVVHNLHRSREAATARPVLPAHAIVGTEAQRQQLGSYVGKLGPLPKERIHQFPVPQERAEPTTEVRQQLAELLIELLGERAHRSLGHGLLKASAARVVTMVTRARALSLAYHQVVPELRGVDLNLVVGASTFEKQVAALLRRGYRPLTQVAQVRELLAPPSGLPVSFAIGFDDGYLDTLEVAAPILKSLGVPFTVYCISDLVVGKRQLPWYELIQQTLYSSRTSGRALQLLAQCEPLGDMLRGRLETPGFLLAGAVMGALKRLGDVQREAVCALLWDKLGDEILARPNLPRYLDRAGVQRLLSFGAEISSHTCRHPILTQVSDEVLATELRESKRLLSELVGQCPGLAYPNGDSDARVEAAAQAAGYEYAVRVEPVAGPPQRFRLGRQMISELTGMGLGGGFSEKIFLAKLLRNRGA